MFWLQLKEGTPVEAIRQFFPQGLPCKNPVPTWVAPDSSLCYEVLHGLSSEQVEQMGRFFAASFETSEEEAIEIISTVGVGINCQWIAEVCGESEEEGRVLEDLQQCGMIDSQLWLRFNAEYAGMSQDPTIGLLLTPGEAFAVLAQLQIAFRHPDNQGDSRLIAEGVARQLQERITDPGTALWEVMEQGWHQEFDQMRNGNG